MLRAASSLDAPARFDEHIGMPRRFAAIALGATVACSSDVRLELDAPDARTFILAQTIDDGAPRITVYADASALPSLRVDGRATIDTVVLTYAEDPTALGLSVGALTPTETAPSRPFPPGGAIHRAIVDDESAGGVAFTALDALPERLADLRFPGSCAQTAPNERLAFVEGCVPSRPPECWGPFERIEDFTPATITIDGRSFTGIVDVGSAREEGGELWLYISRSSSTAYSFTRHFAVPMASPRAPDLSRAQELATLPALARSGAGWTVRGWATPMHVRRDGLEAFFSSSYPDEAWWDEDAFVATREAVGEPWSLGGNLSGRGAAARPRAPPKQHHILGDFQTVLAMGVNRGQRFTPDGELAPRVYAYWRGSFTGEGARAFREIGVIARQEPESEYGIRRIGLSCDGGHLLFWERTGTNAAGALKIAPIVGMPVADASGASKGNVELGVSTEIAWGGPELTSFTESPDCRYLYVSTHTEVHVAERVACP